MQALTRREDLTEIIADYGQVIVDECHHVGAPSISVEGRRQLLVLTERKAHVEALEAALRARGIDPLVLHGSVSARRRLETIAGLDALDPHARRCLPPRGA